MTDETTPIKPLDEGHKPHGGTDVMEYYAYNAADRLEYVKTQIEEREKAHFNLYLLSVSLKGNPVRGDHKDVKDDSDMPPCTCADCEEKRVGNLLNSMKYAINELKAVHSSLT